MAPYDRKFFDRQDEGVLRSARAILPVVMEFLTPRSAIDIGCGTGTWLSVVRELGIEDITGVDGDYINPQWLCVPRECFIAHDLRKPLALDRRFDLVMSLEVAEHLPPDSADEFIETLTGLGPVVLFSAAIPRQGGTDHVNEQWPEFWADHFRRRGFAAIDCIRERVWQDRQVDYFYAQNTLLYVREDDLSRYPKLAEPIARTRLTQLSVVHPRRYLTVADPSNLSLKLVLWLLPRMVARVIGARLRRMFRRGASTP